MFEAIGYDTKSERLDLSLGFLRCLTVCKHARQIGDLCDPAAIDFLFDLYPEGHGNLDIFHRLYYTLIALKSQFLCPNYSGIFVVDIARVSVATIT